MQKHCNIAILASGAGSNCVRLIHHFSNHPCVRIVLVLSNKPDAPVLGKAHNLGVHAVQFNRKQFYEESFVSGLLAEKKVDWIILAGFLWLVPENILGAFPHRIINIHPALLPAYGGKGMYGHHVHEAVIRNREKKSGITIHFVNRNYDDGDLIFQAECPVSAEDTAASLAEKIHLLEHTHFPLIVEKLVTLPGDK